MENGLMISTQILQKAHQQIACSITYNSFTKKNGILSAAKQRAQHEDSAQT